MKTRGTAIADGIALALCLVAVIVAAWSSLSVFENIPHIEDESAYTWQAAAIARGHLSVNSPVCPRCFLVPFVIDANGLRTSKYPPGWPVVLAMGVLAGGRGWVNPLLAGLGAWLIYRLTQKIAGAATAVLALALTVTSPFFVMNSGTLLSHPWSLVLTAAFALAWLDTFDPGGRLPRGLTGLVAALSLGALALTRPLTAVGVALPFAFHGFYLLVRGAQSERRLALRIALGAGLVASLVLLWQDAASGNALRNPYTLWWPYDTIGFGPSVGRQPGGYSISDILPNLKVSLSFGNFDLFGWPGWSGIFLPVGMLAIARQRQAWLPALILPALVLVYCLYWIGSWQYGPRYYYEGLISAVLLSAVGIVWLAGRLAPPSASRRRRWFARVRFALVTGAVMFLVGCNLLYYLPNRVGGMRGLNGASRAQLAPFTARNGLPDTPALLIVHPEQSWLEYGTLYELSSPYLDTPLIVARSCGRVLDAYLAAAYPERQVWHVHPNTPEQLFTGP